MFTFRIAKEDAVGFFFFCIALAAPVGFLTFLWRIIENELTYFAAFVFFFIVCFHKEHVKGFILLCLAVFLPIETVAFFWDYLNASVDLPFGMVSSYVAFVMAFYRIGFRIYSFFSLFVDYELAIKYFCKRCNRVVKEVSYHEPVK